MTEDKLDRILRQFRKDHPPWHDKSKHPLHDAGMNQLVDCIEQQLDEHERKTQTRRSVMLCDIDYGEGESQTRQPTIEQIMVWESEGGCEATDGCWVEPDGFCPHGCPSWMLELGLV